MPDQKLTQLPVLAALSADDIFYVVDDPAGVASSRQVATSVFDARFATAAQGALATTALQPADIGITVQAWDADLDTIAGLAKADGNFIVGDGAAWTVESGAVARASLGLGSLAVINSPLPIINGGSGQVTQQAAIDALTNVVAATNEHVLTKDTATGNAIFKAVGGSSLPVADTQTIVMGSADNTKLLRFEVDGFTAGATRVLTPPNADATIAGLEVANVFTVNQMIDGSSDAIQLRVQANSTQTVNPSIQTWEKSNGTVFARFNADGRVALGQAVVFTDTEVALWATATGRKALALRIITGQTANIMEIQDNSGNLLSYYDSAGGFHVGSPVAGSIFSIYSSVGALHLKRTTTNEPFIYLFNDTANSGGQIRGLNTGGIRFTDWSSAVEIASMTLTAHKLIATVDSDAVADTLSLIRRRATGTPGAGLGSALRFGLHSSTTENQNAARLAALWQTATHASRVADLVAYASYNGGEVEIWRGRAGAAPLFGVLGATPIARPAAYTLASTATRTMPTPEAAFTGIDNAQAGAVYAQVADLLTLQTRLNNVEGVLRQVIIDLASTSGFGFLAAA